MHHKFMIVDKKTVLTGSYNWTANAEDNNYENAVFIRAAEIVQHYQKQFDQIWE